MVLKSQASGLSFSLDRREPPVVAVPREGGIRGGGIRGGGVEGGGGGGEGGVGGGGERGKEEETEGGGCGRRGRRVVGM